MHLTTAYLLQFIFIIKESQTVQELNCLNSFKISELLRFKHSVDLLSCSRDQTPPSLPAPLQETINNTISTNNRSLINEDNPSALPLTIARSYPEPWQEKPSKLQTLFQVSVTGLAFLSFGGYLLCLIVQAIKSKGTTYFHPVATATTTTTNGQLKKIKIFRRSRRMANRTTEEVNSRSGLDDDDNLTLGGPNPEDLYKILLNFAEGYAGTLSVNRFK
ncbi:uncharacterized protein LOC129948594 [Eupeodes corollae]|uniref:uncharacterized protein LOC129948594 n=1 Tax=Eupeodes corollae TaxID=290404 RepID=UPI00249166E1|nr:uncharacterized protein LOC129948594 [Eupeodes corollae]